MNLLVHEDISHVIDRPRNLFSVCRQRCCEINLGGATYALEILPDRVTSNSHHLEKRLLLLMLAVLTIHRLRVVLGKSTIVIVPGIWICFVPQEWTPTFLGLRIFLTTSSITSSGMRRQVLSFHVGLDPFSIALKSLVARFLELYDRILEGRCFRSRRSFGQDYSAIRMPRQ